MSGTSAATKKLTEPIFQTHSYAILKVRGYMQKKDTTMHAGSTNLLTYLNKEKTPKKKRSNSVRALVSRYARFNVYTTF